MMYVRYLGTAVCWTLPSGNFYIGSRDELTGQERDVCERGGGYLPISISVAVVVGRKNV